MRVQAIRALARAAATTRQARPQCHAQLRQEVGCSFWTRPLATSSLLARAESTKSRDVAKPASEVAPEKQSIELFEAIEEQDEGAELDATEEEQVFEGEEVQEGVFVSSPPKGQTASRRRPSSTSIKHLNRLLSRHQVPDLPESELEERFVRGRGPGGQAINKTNSSVSLIHLPTGIRVQSQPTRSREQNRYIARQILKERLDLMRARGELPGAVSEDGKPLDEMNRKEKIAAEARGFSKQELRWEKERRRKLNRKKKVKKRQKGQDEAEE